MRNLKSKLNAVTFAAFTGMLAFGTFLQAHGQNTYYESFNISGPTAVCINGTTAYSYSGPISGLTWSVLGGTFVNGNYGQSVQVIWNNVNNSLSATGQVEDCWYDPEYWPPQQFCNTTIYTSHAFSVSHVVNGGSLNGGYVTRCSPGSGSLTLSGHNGSVVRWEYMVLGTSYWTTINHTGTTYNYSGLTATTTFQAVVQNAGCTATSSTTSIFIDPTSVGGTVNGTTTLCSPGSGTVYLTGQTGNVVRWEYSTGGAWTTITNTSTSLNYTSLTTATSYRAVVKSGVCAETNSATATVTIHTAPTGGSLTSVAMCYPASGNLTLTGYSGTIVRWEYATGGGAWTHTTHTSSSYNYSNLTENTAYRVLVANGVCTSVYSSVAYITVVPQSVGGSLGPSVDVYAPSTSGTLTLTAPYSDIQRWEYNTGGGWTTITQNWPFYNYNVSQSTSYRVATKNSICPETYSNVASINVFPPVLVTPAIPQPVVPGASVTLAANAGYHSYQWFLDGSAIAVNGTSQQYQASKPGIYFVRVKGLASSPHSDSDTVAVKGISGFYKNLNSVTSVSILTEGSTESTSVYSLPAANLDINVVYADGLGRAFQSIAVGQSPSGGDIIAHTAHRKYGLVDTTYMPYTIAARDGRYRPQAIRGNAAENSYTLSEQWNFYHTSPKVAQSDYPYAVARFANDPSLRVTEQGAPGQAWQPLTQHTVRATMAMNNATTYRVRYWNAAGLTTAPYVDNSVMVAITTDENGNSVRTYTDVRGLTVLKQVQVDETLEGISTAWLETYYIYDEYGRVKYILPPKAMKVLGTGASLDANHASVTELIHRFVYDARGRLIEKKVPSATWQYIAYDKLDRVVLVQDGNLRATNRWMFVKYDLDNRVVYSGMYRNTAQTTRAAVQGLLDAITYALPATPWYEVKQTGTPHGYSNNVFPTAGTQANDTLSVNYYDDYDFDHNGSDDFIFDAAHFPGQETTRSTATRGLPTGSKRVVLDAAGAVTTYWIKSAVFYDKYDRPLQTQTNNHLNTAFTPATLDKATVIYDFVKALRTKSTHYQDASTSVRLEDWNDYDHAGRVLKTYRKINGGSTQLIAQYEYNALGQVIDKKLHETSPGAGTFLQSIDYRYTIRGWLESINNAQLAPGANNDETNDYFGLELRYESVESGINNLAQYNGNISALKWKVTGTSGTADQRSYKYVYDKSDRLKAATFQAHDGTGWAREVNTLNETLTYDHNGNIKTLIRSQNLRSNTGITVTSAPQNIDNLTYSYGSNLDKLTKVDDAALTTLGFVEGTPQATEYTYNTDGSMLTDVNKGINGITYNMLGKPQVVNFTSGKKIEYIYDAAGSKLAVKTYQGATLLTNTNYVGGFVYEGSTPALSFFSSPEGRTVKNGASFEYQYAITDHQGNTRALFTSATPAPSSVTANMETSPIAGFENSTTNRVNAEMFDHTDTGSDGTDYSQRLTGGTNAQVGIGKSFKVYPGDKIKIEAYAKYLASSGSGNLPGFAGALLAAFSLPVPGGGETGTPSAGVNTWGSIVAGGGGKNNGSYPKAFVNILVLDKNYKLLDFAWDGISGGEQPVGESGKMPHDYMMQEYTAREEGYIYVYVSNENTTLVEVYFDDVVVTQTKSNLIQYNEYYPFGMQTANSWTRENTLGNNFLANGGTELNKTSALYDLDYRNYDPILGRMNGVDPMTTKYASLTPYNFAFNDPVTFSDVNGADPTAGNMAVYYAHLGMEGREGVMGQAPLVVQDPYYSRELERWTTTSWTWNPSQAGGYNMMAGSYSVPMAGGGLPPATGVTIAIDLSMFVMGETIVSVMNGRAFMALVLPDFEFKPQLKIGTRIGKSDEVQPQSVTSEVVGEPHRTLVNPTGLGMRNDIGGLGYFGAPRGGRLHYGIDFSSVDGQQIIAPISGIIIYSSYLNDYGILTPVATIVPTDTNLSFNKAQILYVNPIGENRRSVTQGDVIGQSVNLQSLGYPNTVGPHVHFQLKQNNIPIDPTWFFGLLNN